MLSLRRFCRAPCGLRRGADRARACRRGRAGDGADEGQGWISPPRQGRAIAPCRDNAWLLRGFFAACASGLRPLSRSRGCRWLRADEFVLGARHRRPLFREHAFSRPRLLVGSFLRDSAALFRQIRRGRSSRGTRCHAWLSRTADLRSRRVLRRGATTASVAVAPHRDQRLAPAPLRAAACDRGDAGHALQAQFSRSRRQAPAVALRADRGTLFRPVPACAGEIPLLCPALHARKLDQWTRAPIMSINSAPSTPCS